MIEFFLHTSHTSSDTNCPANRSATNESLRSLNRRHASSPAATYQTAQSFDEQTTTTSASTSTTHSSVCSGPNTGRPKVAARDPPLRTISCPAASTFSTYFFSSTRLQSSCRMSST